MILVIMREMKKKIRTVVKMKSSRTVMRMKNNRTVARMKNSMMVKARTMARKTSA